MVHRLGILRGAGGRAQHHIATSASVRRRSAARSSLEMLYVEHTPNVSVDNHQARRGARAYTFPLATFEHTPSHFFFFKTRVAAAHALIRCPRSESNTPMHFMLCARCRFPNTDSVAQPGQGARARTRPRPPRRSSAQSGTTCELNRGRHHLLAVLERDPALDAGAHHKQRVRRARHFGVRGRPIRGRPRPRPRPRSHKLDSRRILPHHSR